MDGIKVSIITVCYNSKKTIRRTIESVLAQTYKNIEYIIVDGDSTDGTMSVISEYKDRIACIVSKPDHGLYHAMNRGIMLSTGEIIGILNSDDWYAEHAVEDVVGCFMREKCELVYGKYTKAFPNGVYQECDSGDAADLYYKMSISHPTVFVKREIYEQYGIFNQKYRIAADYELLCRFYDCGVKMSRLQENIAYFTMSGLSNAFYSETVEETEKIALKYWDGESIEIRDKIEKFTASRKNFAKTKLLMNEFESGGKNKPEFLTDDQRQYVIFGAGTYGIEVAEFLENQKCRVKCYVDNDVSKWGKITGKLRVENPDILMKERVKVIITNVHYEEEIAEQLESMGYQRGCDFETIGKILEKGRQP